MINGVGHGALQNPRGNYRHTLTRYRRTGAVILWKIQPVGWIGPALRGRARRSNSEGLFYLFDAIKSVLKAVGAPRAARRRLAVNGVRSGRGPRAYLQETVQKCIKYSFHALFHNSRGKLGESREQLHSHSPPLAPYARRPERFIRRVRIWEKTLFFFNGSPSIVPHRRLIAFPTDLLKMDEDLKTGIRYKAEQHYALALRLGAWSGRRAAYRSDTWTCFMGGGTRTGHAWPPPRDQSATTLLNKLSHIYITYNRNVRKTSWSKGKQASQTISLRAFTAERNYRSDRYCQQLMKLKQEVEKKRSELMN
ncbi:hypothetical protein EVAR_33492_1 [Eumeta japonica]|uniref:Uncharacterized protein n=1 Tax=Eumeta variegata TaxID=151549 RepID=A0A4C1WHY2_EUMVA|nr:hypothetical protein EVAR_33492_1 [Eumeta japonica]